MENKKKKQKKLYVKWKQNLMEKWMHNVFVCVRLACWKKLHNKQTI